MQERGLNPRLTLHKRADAWWVSQEVRHGPQSDIITPKRGAAVDGVGLTQRQLRSCATGRVSERPEMRRYRAVRIGPSYPQGDLKRSGDPLRQETAAPSRSPSRSRCIWPGSASVLRPYRPALALPPRRVASITEIVPLWFLQPYDLGRIPECCSHSNCRTDAARSLPSLH